MKRNLNDFNGEGRIQKAVESWEKSASDKVRRDDSGNTYSDEETRKEIKRNIKSIEKHRMPEDEQEPPTREVSVPKDAQNGFREFNRRQKNAPNKQKDVDVEVKSIDKNSDKNVEDIRKSREIKAAEFRGVAGEQAHSLLRRLLSVRIRLAVCVFLSFILVMLGIAPYLKLPLPPQVSSSPAEYTVVNLLILLIIGAMDYKTAFGGIIKLFSFRKNSSSLVSLAFYGALVGGGVILGNAKLYKSPGSVPVYAAPAAICIVCSLIGDMFACLREIKNMKYVYETKENKNYYSLYNLSSESVTKALKSIGEDDASILWPEVSGDRDFAEDSSPSTEGRAAAIFAPLSLLVAVVAAAGTVVLGKGNVASAAAAFSGICCFASPFMFGLLLPAAQYKISERLHKKQALVNGSGAASACVGAGAMVTDAGLIFPGTAKVLGIKMFSGQPIEKAVIYGASLAFYTESPLSDSFLHLISSSGMEHSPLKKPSNIRFKDEKGLVAEIDGSKVLFGNRALLRKNMIEPPPRAYEANHMTDGRDLIYLAVDGRLTSMFIVKYSPAKGIAHELKRLSRMELDVVIESSDSNITPEMIEEKYGLSKSGIRVVYRMDNDPIIEDKNEKNCPIGITFADFKGYSEAVISSIRLGGTMWACTAIQIFSSIIGMFTILLPAFLGVNISAETPLFMLGYEGFWVIPVLLICFFRRL